MLMSESTANLFGALIKARTDIETVVKDKAGFGYNYATLDNVINMLKNVLPLYDLGYAQFPETLDGKDGVTTIVFHKSGEYMSARYEMEATPVKGTNITQQKGASITYTRRYSLCSIFGIPTEDDTDGVIKTSNDGVIHLEETTEEKPSVADIVAGINGKMTLDNWKGFYKRAIDLYPKGTPDYKTWSTAFNAKKESLESEQTQKQLQSDSDYVNNI